MRRDSLGTRLRNVYMQCVSGEFDLIASLLFFRAFILYLLQNPCTALVHEQWHTYMYMYIVPL